MRLRTIDYGSRRLWRIVIVCAGLNITGTIGLIPGQRTALKLMGAVDHNDEP